MLQRTPDVKLPSSILEEVSCVLSSILLERYSLLDHCGSFRKPESSGWVMYPHSHLSIHPLNIHQSTHSASTYTSIQQLLIHPPIQYPSVCPFNIHPSIHPTSMHPPTYSTSVSICPSINPHVHAPNNSPKPIRLMFIYLLIIRHSIYTHTSIHTDCQHQSIPRIHSTSIHSHTHPSVYP